MSPPASGAARRPRDRPEHDDRADDGDQMLPMFTPVTPPTIPSEAAINPPTIAPTMPSTISIEHARAGLIDDLARDEPGD